MKSLQKTDKTMIYHPRIRFETVLSAKIHQKRWKNAHYIISLSVDHDTPAWGPGQIELLGIELSKVIPLEISRRN